MSRNRKRIQIPQNQSTPKKQAPIPPQAIKQTEQGNPFGISFVVPTETVKLPSAGALYDENSPLKGLTEVEVKAVTAAEEDIMINDSYIQQGVVFDRLIDAIMLTPNVRSQDMMDCDKIAVLMSARKTGYGDKVDFSVQCDGCDHNYEMQVSLESVLTSVGENTYSPSSGEGWEFLADSNPFSFQLPSTELEVSMKLMSPGDVKDFDSAKKQKERLNLPFNETIEFLRTVIVSVQGITDKSSINKLAEILPAIDARKIRTVHNKNIPKIETAQETTCPNCGLEQEKEVPFSLGWFWSE